MHLHQHPYCTWWHSHLYEYLSKDYITRPSCYWTPATPTEQLMCPQIPCCMPILKRCNARTHSPILASSRLGHNWWHHSWAIGILEIYEAQQIQTHFANSIGRWVGLLGTRDHRPHQNWCHISFTNMLFPLAALQCMGGWCSLLSTEDRISQNLTNSGRWTYWLPKGCSTPTADLATIKLHFNSTISTPQAHFFTLDVKIFYLNMPLDRPECMHMHLDIMRGDHRKI